MHSVLRTDEQERTPTGTVRFEGEAHGSGVSLFLVDNQPGEGPDLHRHPYSETWIVRSGSVRFTADGEDIEAGPGDIVVVGPETPHNRTAIERYGEVNVIAEIPWLPELTRASLQEIEPELDLEKLARALP